MKKIFFYAAIIALNLLLITSCKKDEIGGTATENMAGEWYVTAVAVDASGKVVYEDADLFGLGHFHLDTYNTSSNKATEMWIDDLKNFQFNFKTKVAVDQNAMGFSATNVDNAYPKGNKITISNGKVLLKAAKTPSGSVADSIVFTVSISNDTYPAQYGYAAYRIAGYRYTGLKNDD